MTSERTAARPGAVAGTLVVVGLLFTCLWPFRSVANTVAWQSGDSGVVFAGTGTMISATPLVFPKEQESAPCSISFQITPRGQTARSTIFATYNPKHPTYFSVQQSGPDLVVAKDSTDPHCLRGKQRVYVDDVLREHPVRVTINTKTFGTSIFINGKIQKRSDSFTLTCSDFAGTLVIGTSPTDDAGWTGKYRDIFIFLSNTGTVEDQASALENPVTAYTFTEGSGSIAHSRVHGAPDLIIPPKYQIVNKAVLAPPTLDNPVDIALNIAGYVPLGLCLMTYFSPAGLRKAAGYTLVLGLTMSTVIELAQVNLSTRSSDLTDVLTNSFGTLIGMALFSYTPVGQSVHTMLEIAEQTLFSYVKRMLCNPVVHILR